MKVFAPDDFAALVGIDWADQKHDICVCDRSSGDYRNSIISSRPEAIHEWAGELQKAYPSQRIAVACELNKGPLIYALSQHAHLVLYPLNPFSVAKYREVFCSSGAKDDPTDARFQAELLHHHMDKLTPLEPESPELRALSQLTENRRKLVQDRVRLTNRLTAVLKNYYPQVLDWFTEKDTRVFCDFLIRWPTLDKAKRARSNTLKTFFHRHNVRSSTKIEERLNGIRDAVPLTTDEGVIVPNQLMMEALIAQYRALLDAIAKLDQAIKQRFQACTDRQIFESLPGAGPVFAPRLLAAFGENRERYSRADEIQRYAGIAPVLERSGKQQWVHWRYSCPTFLRQTFVEWAGETVRYSFWAKAYYQQQKARGKSHHVIVRALAYKWIRILFRCWKDRTPYDESTYLNALKKRKSPLLEFAVSN